MRNTRFISAAALTVVCGLMAVPAAASDQTDVIAAESQINVAIAQHDVAATGKLLAPDYVLTFASGTIYDRESFLKLVGDPAVVYSTNRAHDQTVHVYNDSTAVVTGILDIKGKAGESPFAYHMRYTDTWVKIGGQWVQAAGQSANIPAKSPVVFTKN